MENMKQSSGLKTQGMDIWYVASPSGSLPSSFKLCPWDQKGPTLCHMFYIVINRKIFLSDGKVPTDWERSFIVCLYKGNGDALDRGNYRGLKLTEQAMKILERIVMVS